MIELHYVNDTFLRVKCDRDIHEEIYQYFTFEVPNARHMPNHVSKGGWWDGKMHLYDKRSSRILSGLAERIKQFASDRDYNIVSFLPSPKVFSEEQLTEFINFIKPKYEVRDYQFTAFRLAVNDSRGLFISPTASGKSYIIYLTTQFLRGITEGNVLIIVPTTGLVKQMKSDFLDYNLGKALPIHTIMEGAKKEVAPITIATWQSIYKMPKPWFSQFKCIIGDEVHLFKATSLKSIMEKADQTPYRIGLTGTLDGTLTNQLVLEGQFGRTHTVTDYQTLQDEGHIVKPKVKVLAFQYDKPTRSIFFDTCKDFAQEVQFLVQNQARNKNILHLTSALKGNILVLFNSIEHGEFLYRIFKEKFKDRPVYLIHGKIDADERERIRHAIESDDNAIAVCSYGTFSTGVNVKKLHHLIYAGPLGKSMIRLLQSIGRGLRVHDSKSIVTIWDLVDDLTYRKRKNFGLKHLMDRINIYDSVGFEYQIITRNVV